jgi:predicted ribosomally synthesized peptide with SipW-like signal peptide
MTADKQLYNLSRRKVLGGLGAIGLASAGAGLGTSAYFNDTETFQGNELVAGTLDLKVDWQQKYYGPTEEWAFVNAHPDHDNDGEQSIDLGDGGVAKYSDNDKNLVDVLDCNTPGFTEDDYYFGPDQSSLVSLSDVKPGDEGEITFSLHLCDNPGYVWLTADNFTQSEGPSPTEPESEVDIEDGGDLADNTFVELWYDENCNNLLDRGENGESNPLCVQFVLDASGSMAGTKNANTKAGANDLAEQILDANPDNRVGVTYFSASGYDNSAQVQLSVDSTNDADSDSVVDPKDVDTVSSVINALPANGGSTAIGAGIETATADLADCPPGHDRIMIVLSNGGENVMSDSQVVQLARDAETDENVRVITIGIGTGNTALLDDVATDPESENAYTGTDPAQIEAVFNSISEVILAGETVILGNGDGLHTSDVTLTEAMDIIERNDGMIPLDGDGNMAYGDGATSENRDCFEARTGHCIGLRWWVPTTVGNEIQGDSVSFDMGFYAEQCRHNDGSGPETEPATQPQTAPQ